MFGRLLIRVRALVTSEPSHLNIRTTVALVAGVTASVVYWRVTHSVGEPGGDFWQHWFAARLLLNGRDPYTSMGPETLRVAGQPSTSLGHWYFYPLPAAFLGLPFAFLSASLAGAAFVMVSVCTLVYVLSSRFGYRSLVLLASAPALGAVSGAQSVMLMMAVAWSPAFAWLTTVKPNIGLALFSARPNRWTVIGGTALGAAALLVLPRWPQEWLANLAMSPHHRAPITYWYGFPLLLAATRWRRSEARLLVVMACVPQVPLFYDQLPLALVPQTERERLTFAWLSWAGYLGWIVTSVPGQIRVADMAAAPPWILGCLYLPALVMVLRRPNVKAQ